MKKGKVGRKVVLRPGDAGTNARKPQNTKKASEARYRTERLRSVAKQRPTLGKDGEAQRSDPKASEAQYKAHERGTDWPARTKASS